MEDEIVDVNIKIEELKLATLSMTVANLGGQMSVQKQMKFKDLGLAEVEKGNFQCLVCKFACVFKNDQEKRPCYQTFQENSH